MSRNYILKEQHGVLSPLLGGWQYGGILSWQTGAHGALDTK
jgi:hypothetical protein